MRKRLFVGNLDYSITGEELAEVFSEAGKVVSSDVITDNRNRSKGFGFVEMESEEEAKKAMEMFESKEIKGRPIHIDEAKPRKNRSNKENNYFGN